MERGKGSHSCCFCFPAFGNLCSQISATALLFWEFWEFWELGLRRGIIGSCIMGLVREVSLVGFYLGKRFLLGEGSWIAKHFGLLGWDDFSFSIILRHKQPQLLERVG